VETIRAAAGLCGFFFKVKGKSTERLGQLSGKPVGIRVVR